MLRSNTAVTGFLRWMLKWLYRWYGLEEIAPDEPFDLRRHQLIPGRRTMIRRLDSITRHRSEVRSIRGDRVELADGDHFSTDMVLWATGYRMHLESLGLPELAAVHTPAQLRSRLGSLVRSRDHPALFFLGMSLVDSTSATPFFAAIEARSIVAHILGRCEIPRRRIPHVLAYWDVLTHFASFDHATYPGVWGRIKLVLLALWYQLLRNRSVRI